MVASTYYGTIVSMFEELRCKRCVEGGVSSNSRAPGAQPGRQEEVS
jgi:hypothetical protein